MSTRIDSCEMDFVVAATTGAWGCIDLAKDFEDLVNNYCKNQELVTYINF